MKIRNIMLLACLAFALVSCKNDKKTEDSQTGHEGHEHEEVVKSEKIRVSVLLEPRSDSNTTGRVNFIEENGVVTLYAEIEGLDPGTHAIHLHEFSDCSAADGTSTGGHWNPTFEKHGKWGDAEGYHRGDIGNFEVGDNGIGNIEFKTDLWCIGCDDETKNIIGKSVIVHAGVDDFVTQPTGDAGGRISCGGIIELPAQPL